MSREFLNLITVNRMLKITVYPKGKITTLVLEGCLCGPWVEELDRCSREIRKDQEHALMVDLTDVSFIDPDGEALLTSLWRNGVRLHSTGCLTKSMIEEIISADRTCVFRPGNRRKTSKRKRKNDPSF